MLIYKFGGASVKDALAVVNTAKVIKAQSSVDLVVVVSAMGKMTNSLEDLLELYREQSPELEKQFKKIKDFHFEVVRGLKMPMGNLEEDLNKLFQDLEKVLSIPPSDDYDFDYDQIVSYGELLSTTIVSSYLYASGLENSWVDARKTIRTDATFREAKINWEKTSELANKRWIETKEAAGKRRAIMITQGFIGHTNERSTTTLGREGSDFSAAILGHALNAESVTIWKDVPGVLNADPKFYSDAVLLKRISYKEAIELAYFGASVIHPKTIKPLQNKGIVLFVRSFQDFTSEGTRIDSSTFSDSLVPSFIFKKNQLLVSFTPRDFSFIAEDNLSELFSIFADLRVKTHLMQNSAINFSVCIDHDKNTLESILKACKERYEVLYNASCELVTIRHYDSETVSRLLIGKKVLVEQRSRNTARMVLQ